jgi:hypothetical protein
MATRFSLTDPNPGVWFAFNDDDPETGRICIRVINGEKQQELRKRTVKKRIEYKHGQRFEYEDRDDEAYSRLLWDYVIMDWERLENDDGTSIECTAENKNKLMMANVRFGQFVGSCVEKVNALMEARTAEIEKN